MGKKEEEKAKIAKALERFEQRKQQLIAREREYREIAGITDSESPEDRVMRIISNSNLPGREVLQATEIERKWRVHALPDTLVEQLTNATNYQVIKQGYTQTGVRLREITDYALDEATGSMIQGKTRYVVSWKTHVTDDRVARYEVEKTIDETDIEGIARFKRCWDERVEGSFVLKRRYKLHDTNQNLSERKTIELDIYDTSQFSDAARAVYGEPLIMAEIEFNGLTHADAQAYSFPPTMGEFYLQHVTSLAAYDNKSIAYFNGGNPDYQFQPSDLQPPPQIATGSSRGTRRN